MRLDIHRLSVHMQGRFLIRDISLSFESGHLFVILGPNGSGKSTLLKALARIWPPREGEIFLDGVNIASFNRQQLSSHIHWVAQTPSILFDFTVAEMVAMGCYTHLGSLHEKKESTERALGEADLVHLRHRRISQLSGGERQRVYIARAIASKAPILLFDEPTAYLDLRHQIEVWLLLKKLDDQGKHIIAAAHDLHSAKSYGHEVALLHQGRCKGKGSYQEMITSCVLSKVFEITQEHAQMFL